MDTEPGNLNTVSHVRDGEIMAVPQAQNRKGRIVRYMIPVFYLLGDISGIYLSFILAFKLRFGSFFAEFFPVVHGIPDLTLYLNALLFVSAVWVFIFSIYGHYRRRSPSSFDRFYETARGVVSGTFIILATTFFYRGDSFSRLVLAIACLLSITLIWLTRELIYRLEKGYLKRGVISKRAIFVGGGERGAELFGKLTRQPAWGIVPIGFVYDEGTPGPRLGGMAQLDDIIKANSIDLIVFNMPQETHEFITDFVMKSENLSLEYMISPDIMGLMTFNSEAGQIEGIPVLRWGKTPIEGYARAVKRTFDTVFSGLGIAITSLLMLAIAVAVKLDSPGPILFTQRRIGRNGREFTMYKFRSMSVGSDDSVGPGWTVKDDPRRTRVGRTLRRCNIDELPQLFNVFLGQMSLVGPRPEQPGYVEKFRDDIPRYFQRHKVKSGVTGWAQVNGFRGDTSITERTKYDLYYVENWSLIFDIKIIFLTLKNIFKSSNAY